MGGEALFEWTGGDAPVHPGKSLGQLILDSLRQHAATNSKPAQIDGVSGSAKSYPELLREVVHGAAGWRARGLSSKDTVGIFTRNNHHKYAAVLGAMLEGITLSTMTPACTEDELRLLLARVDIQALVCEPANLHVALKVRSAGLAIFVTTDAADASWPEAVYSVGDLMRSGAESGVAVDAYQAGEVGDLRKHVACIAYSSGTTGLPKGVSCSNYAIALNGLCAMGSRWKVLPEDIVLVTSPVSWITGIMYTIIPIFRGCTRVLFSYTNETECLDMLRRHKISMTFIAPARYFLLAGLVKSLREKGTAVDLSNWRIGIAGGAPMTADLQKTCSQVLGVPIAQGFGCTEVLLASSDDPPVRIGSVGKLAPGVRARLVDLQTGADIREPNADGELRLMSPCYMLGYVGDPETTAKSVDEHGWYRTGDLARFDKDGFLYITDRIKELLKFMNLEMTPAEIEDVLMSHPAVKDACVVGRSHKVVGDIPTAFVVLFTGMQATEKELQQFVKDRLSQNKQLRGGVFFLDEIPTSNNGKYDRRSLRNRLSKLPPISDQELGLTAA